MNVDTRLGGYETWFSGEPPDDYYMRVPDLLKSCVCFLCVKKGSSDADTWTYGGTGFFVSMPSTMHGVTVRFGYLVTARHNIIKAEAHGALYIRANTRDGGSRHIEIREQWYYPDNDDAIDIAVLPVGAWRGGLLATAIPVEMFATDIMLKRYSVGIGEDLFIAGLFTSHYGSQKNLPILRAGILAAMPDEPLKDKNTGLPYYAFLAEVRSLGGLSGSPVFAYVERSNRQRGEIKTVAESVYKDFLLLGLIRGHWDHERQDSALDYADDTLIAVNKGIATVTPVEPLLSLLRREDLAKLRRTDMEVERGKGMVLDFV